LKGLPHSQEVPSQAPLRVDPVVEVKRNIGGYGLAQRSNPVSFISQAACGGAGKARKRR